MKFLLLFIVIISSSCDINHFPTYFSYNSVRITKIELFEFQPVNSNGNKWDDESYPDIYLIFSEENQPLIISPIRIEVEKSNLPIDIFFSTDIISNYFYKDLEIFLYDKDELTEDDLMGRSGIFNFSNAIINNSYENILYLENAYLKLKVHLNWLE